MFESIPPPSASARLRNAAIPPVAAFFFAHVYYSVTAFLGSAPTLVFYRIAGVITMLGAIIGAVQIARVGKSERIRGVAIGWTLIAIAAIVICARTSVGLLLGK